MNKGDILGVLPPSEGDWRLIDKDQDVADIIEEVCAAHKRYAADYDLFALRFDKNDLQAICAGLADFCKAQIQYKEEGETQTTALPAGILERGYGDCKHYALFNAGVLDAISRLTGKKIDWCYRFASYRIGDRVPHHVFVVVREGGQEYWIDPTPGARGRSPIWQIDKKVYTMPLYTQIAGIGDEVVAQDAPAPALSTITENDLSAALENIDTSLDISEDEFTTIQMLLNYGVIDENGNVNLPQMDMLLQSLPAEQAQRLRDAYNHYLSMAAIGNVFGDIWRGVKVVTLSIPRNAFLGLVALNIFGYASKMNKALNIPDAKEDLLNKWYSLGGKKDALEGAIKSGVKKPAILAGVNARINGPEGAAPAWLALASGIIAAIMPFVTALLQKHNAYTSDLSLYDNAAALQYQQSGNSLMNFVRANPLIVVGGAALLLYMLWERD